MDSADDYATSADPGGGAQAWKRVNLGQGYNTIVSVACPTRAVRLASDATGQVLTATHPAKGPGEPATLGGPLGCYHGACFDDVITAVSCPSPSFCAATDGSNLSTSSDPTAGRAAWHKSPLPATGATELVCPAATLCIAASGRVLAVTSDPSDPTPT